MNKLTTETTSTPGTPLVAEQGRPYTPGQGEAMRTPATMETATHVPGAGASRFTGRNGSSRRCWERSSGASSSVSSPSAAS